MIEYLARHVCAVRAGRIRVAVDGLTAAGKTSLSIELAAAVRQLGRPTLRASLDDFKKPWRDAREKGYDRVSGEGYYRNAPDFDAARELLLKPAGSEGSGLVALCAYDPLTGVDHRTSVVRAPDDAVLIADSVFAFRPEYNGFWDLRIWVDVSPEVAQRRGIERDTAIEGAAEAQQLHEGRYRPAELLYLAEVDPVSLADFTIDNNDFAHPVLRTNHDR